MDPLHLSRRRGLARVDVMFFAPFGAARLLHYVKEPTRAALTDLQGPTVAPHLSRRRGHARALRDMLPP